MNLVPVPGTQGVRMGASGYTHSYTRLLTEPKGTPHGHGDLVFYQGSSRAGLNQIFAF